MLDPFLLFDVFESDQSQDYIGGFPDHPHRGFETVTYLLNGRMRHKDSAGHEGVIGPGGVQWMTAGKGIIHSEMPEQEEGLLQGFQLWVNLPANEKMCEPAYQEFSAETIAIEEEHGKLVRLIAGSSNQGTTGPVINNYVSPIYMDVMLASNHSFIQDVNHEDNAFVYVIEGEVSVGESNRCLSGRQLGVLQEGSLVELSAVVDSRFLFISGKPLNEPIARGGPFVMNTREQVEQAFNDYKNNRLV